MMLLLGRLITLLLLLLRPPVKISFSLLRRWKYHTLPSMGRFVVGNMLERRVRIARKAATERQVAAGTIRNSVAG
nr:hypothetical protein [Anaplasma phagocytophilum]